MSPRFATVLLFLSAAVFCGAQDTRGGLVPTARVMLMAGTAAVEDLIVGSEIWTWLPGEKPAPGKVTAIRRVHADSYIRLRGGNGELEATGSHRIMLADGVLVRLDTVKVGQKVVGWTTTGRVDMTVAEVRIYPSNLVVYDLTVEGHRPFAVGGVLVSD
jgi:hypothetical protein